MARVRALRRFKNAGLRRELQTSPSGFNYAGRRRPIDVISMNHDPMSQFVSVEFNQVVILAAVPRYINSDSEYPLNAELTDPVTMLIEYPAGFDGSITIPFQDPAVRNYNGGFVNPQKHVFPP